MQNNQPPPSCPSCGFLPPHTPAHTPVAAVLNSLRCRSAGTQPPGRLLAAAPALLATSAAAQAAGASTDQRPSALLSAGGKVPPGDVATPGGVDTEPVDIWRDSLVRYLGYANEVGESFRYISPGLVVPSYLVSFGYVLGDTADKAQRAHASQGPVFATAADVLVWQTLASVAVPGFTINRVVKAANAFVASGPAKRALPGPVLRWLPTAVGLGVIPLIIRPIDWAVDRVMDVAVRPWLLPTAAGSGLGGDGAGMKSHLSD